MSNKLELGLLRESTKITSWVGVNAVLNWLISPEKNKEDVIKSVGDQVDGLIGELKPQELKTYGTQYMEVVNADLEFFGKKDIISELKMAIGRVDKIEIQKYFGMLYSISENPIVAFAEYAKILEEVFNTQLASLLVAINQTDLNINSLVPSEPTYDYEERFAAKLSSLINQYDTKTIPLKELVPVTA